MAKEDAGTQTDMTEKRDKKIRAAETVRIWKKNEYDRIARIKPGDPR